MRHHRPHHPDDVPRRRGDRATPSPVVLDRDGSTIVLEPYAPNVVRVTLSLDRKEALAAPGYGFVATPAAAGWTHESGRRTGTVYRSARLVVDGRGRTARASRWRRRSTSPASSTARRRPRRITFSTPEGRTLLQLTGWSMSVPNHKDGNAAILARPPPLRRALLQVGAVVRGARRRALLRLRPAPGGLPRPPRPRGPVLARLPRGRAGRASACRSWSPTTATAFVWDNPSKTTIEPGHQRADPLDVRGRQPRVLLRDRRERRPTRSTPATACSPARRRCCRRRRTATSSASSATPRRTRSWRSRRATATAACRPTSWSSTGSTTRGWARWTSSPRSGPTRRP